MTTPLQPHYEYINWWSGTELRAYRELVLGISKQELAGLLGVARQTLSNWEDETNPRGVPNPWAQMLTYLCMTDEYYWAPPADTWEAFHHTSGREAEPLEPETRDMLERLRERELDITRTATT